MFEELVASWQDVLLVALATAVMYLTFLLLVRLVGPRSIAQLSAVDLGCLVMAGAVMGRTALLVTPTLARGIVALLTLFTLRGLLWLLRRRPAAERVVSPPPVLLVSRQQLLVDNMCRAHVTVDDLRQELRAAGVRRPDQVESVILERSGRLTVIHRSAPAEPWLLADISQ
ncbi:MAG: DUF421 domain-containing protein [Nocardioidaceae bacterium]|nr:DUF421 domain-containing protein [Nocardioidaceae bacterium]MDQ3324860.1 DUF421 domain-containing protein [Actinomycetota bacterium]